MIPSCPTQGWWVVCLILPVCLSICGSRRGGARFARFTVGSRVCDVNGVACKRGGWAVGACVRVRRRWRKTVIRGQRFDH